MHSRSTVGAGFPGRTGWILAPCWPQLHPRIPQSALDPTTGLLTQTWLGHLSVAPPIPLTLTSDLQLSQSLLGYSLSSEAYITQWTQGFSLLAPYESGLDYARLEKLGASLKMPVNPIGVDLEASTQAQGSNYALPAAPGPYTQENDVLLSAATLFKVGQGDSTLSVGYKRLLSVTTTPCPVLDS